MPDINMGYNIIELKERDKEGTSLICVNLKDDVKMADVEKWMLFEEGVNGNVLYVTNDTLYCT